MEYSDFEGQIEKWWFELTIVLAEQGIDSMTPAQLAQAMSNALSISEPGVPEPSVLAIGRDWAVVANGALTNTFVFPWAHAIRTGLYSKQKFEGTFLRHPGRQVYGEPLTLDAIKSLTAQKAIEQLLATLSRREATVLGRRYALEGDKRQTLEEIGRHLSVTRERIRQIESKAIRKARHPNRLWRLWRAFAAHFIRSKGLLVLREDDLTSYHHLMFTLLHIGGRTLHHIDDEYLTYTNLPALERYTESFGKDESVATPPFLSHEDEKRLSWLREKKVALDRSRWTRPRMAYEVLRELKRAAHYSEIAEMAARLFPDRAMPATYWLSTLSLDSARALGIVWIGSKGMYGLEEHGYQRPEADLYVQVVQIVKDIFDATGNPVSETQVIGEMRRLRPIVVDTSIKMALSFNERLSSVGNGRYVPKQEQPESGTPTYDISAAFEAFTADSDDKDNAVSG